MMQEKWEILRFSGWTAEGSKRTIMIWSKESIELVVSFQHGKYARATPHGQSNFPQDICSHIKVKQAPISGSPKID